ncbi:MAG TPA: helix-turn-helix domain-containing protein [Acidimicrobiia bacterium]|jgi:transcriptional regulator with XRE-family HTH domain|nr:helix-turn-helix domain-containing protein [Acidimicrobiia bacterium]
MAGSRDFGKIINERRLSLGYSLGQLANRMGTTATKVRSWERGDAVPDNATLEQLAEELNMSSGVLRATLPEAEPQVDEPDDATSVVAAPVFSSEADTATDSADQDDEDEAESKPAPRGGDEGLEPDAAAGSEGGGRAAEDSPEPTALIAATAGNAADEHDAVIRDHEGDAGSDLAAPDAGTDVEDSVDTDEQALLLDAPTEAVEVVPSGPVMEPAAMVAAPAMVATATPRVDLNDVGIPESSRFFAPVEQVMAVVFDPDKNYLAWIRLILIIVVFFVLLRVLAWAVPEFFDALKDILDTIESTPSEPDPATEFIEGLGRITGA